MDLAYGRIRIRTLVKFTMLEFIARVPYQAWERMGYLALAQHRGRSALARRVFARIVEPRAEQGNEQRHLLILQDLVQRRSLRQSLLLHRLAPWLIAFFYYHVSWRLFVIRPAWSYRLNADFEDHAEHEYMSYVAEHPELEAEADPGSYAAQYGQYGSLADLFRQIGHDERVHKLDSLANMSAPRPHPDGHGCSLYEGCITHPDASLIILATATPIEKSEASATARRAQISHSRVALPDWKVNGSSHRSADIGARIA
jgi:ubiquinol oxidase